MKCISLWQPFASLAAYGFKTHETRSWAAPKSLIGQRIGIASTKNVKPEQRSTFADPEFQRFYSTTGLSLNFDDLPLGHLLGTVVLDSVEPVTDELLEEISLEEQAYGWHRPGYFVWRLREPEPLITPIAIRGAQGIYDWHGDVEAAFGQNAQSQNGPQGVQERPDDIRRHLRVI